MRDSEPLIDSENLPQGRAGLGGWVRCLSSAFDSGLVLLDGEGQVSLVNQAAENLLGHDLDGLRQSWPELRGRISEQTSKDVWIDGGTVEVDLAKDGDDHRRLQLTVEPIDLEDCRGHLIQVRDMAVVHAGERDRLLASQMRSISHLYRSMAHDLRSPLNAMVVNLELLGEAVKPGASGDDLESRRQRYVDVLQEEMKRLNRRLRGFLSQTAPAETGRQRTFDLVGMIREMVLFVEPQADKQKAELDVKLPDRALTIHGNPDAIRQTLLSLLVNALAALDTQERPDGDGGRVEIGAHGIAGQVVVWVADDGPGIPLEIADRVFDLHFTTKEDGSGIGLHVARETIESEGGELTLSRDDEAGPGTVFKIRLPVHSDDESSKESSI